MALWVVCGHDMCDWLQQTLNKAVSQAVDFIVVIFFSIEFYIDSRHEKSLDKLMERYQ